MSTEKLVIKKYPNRRLYDTSTSCYITLADVKQMVLDNVEVQVVDAKTGEDLTRAVLLQIIMDEEAGNMPMFSYDALTHLIRFYGNAMQGLMGNFLDKNMELFMQMQGKLNDQAQSVMKGDGANLFSNPQLWGDFMKFQGPSLQKMMGEYLESGASMFMQMQQQMQDQTRGMFSERGGEASKPAAAEPAPAAEPAKASGAKKRTAAAS